MDNIVIGILAHVDSGKTTVTEAMLYETGAIKSLGRVDHKDAFLDTNQIERERGITVFSKVAKFNIGEKTVSLLDTPGHVDFSSEMERTLSVLDYGILVISGSEGVQSHTEILWKLLKDNNIPTFIFVNKMDMSYKSKEDILDNINKELKDNFIDFSENRKKADRDEEIAMCHEEAIGRFLSYGHIDQEIIAQLIKDRQVFPVYFGSGLKSIGIREFLQGLDEYTLVNDSSDSLGGIIYKVSRDEQGNRLCFVKITSGTLKVKGVISGVRSNEESWSDKVNQIRIYSGDKYQGVDVAQAGQICALTGINQGNATDVFGIEKPGLKPQIEPVLSYGVDILSNHNVNDVLKFLKIIEEEDPKLYVLWDSEGLKINVRLMGQIQLEILKNTVKNRFGASIDFNYESIVYKETVANIVEGVGHFEPLKHYAEVHLVIEPGPLGSGIVIKNNCRDEDLDRNWQNLILSHIGERTHRGVLTGSQLTDVKITLVDGRAHKKHTMGGDFREATYRAIRQGLLQSESILLEPWYKFKITVPRDHLGRVMSDIKKYNGNFEIPTSTEDIVEILGKGPVVGFKNYQMEINNYSHGKGRIFLASFGYRPCVNQKEVIEAIGYDGENDPNNIGDSVFCSNGAGFNVKWYDVFDYMHGPSYLENKAEKEARLNENIMSFGSTLMEDAELMAIFERTYGKVKRQPELDQKLIASEEYMSNPNKSRKRLNVGKSYLLIDGYNLIHQWKELKELSKVSFGGARDRLADIMCNYAGVKDTTVIIVFDAYKVKDNPGKVEKIHNIFVVYTKSCETADVYIEKVTYQMDNSTNVRVVTSDALEQLIITGHGALKISSSEFEEEVKSVEEKIRELLV
ncbi:MAG: TetM/TetW/TetO/TetS family tetracycline resistance ribosomal protection protein [Anaerovoracaceae bacterium]